jgi:P27 family predicted phage terminase small subunit
VEAWDATLAALDAVGLFHRADRAIVARYAVLTGHYHACLVDLRETGPFMETKTGYRAPSPAATNLLKLADKLGAIEAALGLTPRSRANMKVQPSSLDDEEERLLRKFIIPPPDGGRFGRSYGA